MLSIDLTTTTELCKLMGDWGSDKGNEKLDGRHTYTPIYFKILEKIRHDPINIFELGLGTLDNRFACNMNGYCGKVYTPGNSLRAWKEYCPKAYVYGADIDKQCLFKEERIETYFCDQTDKNVISSMWSTNSLKDVQFDLIIDDGLHYFEPNCCFFENSIHKLKVGGYFVIEDIHVDNVIKFKGKIEEWKQRYTNLDFQIFEMSVPANCSDNNVVVVLKRAIVVETPPAKKFIWNRR